MQSEFRNNKTITKGVSMRNKITTNLLRGVAALVVSLPLHGNAADIAKPNLLVPVTVAASSGGIAGQRFVGLNVCRPTIGEGRLSAAVVSGATQFTVDADAIFSGISPSTLGTSDNCYIVEFTSGAYVGLIKKISSITGRTATVVGTLPALDDKTTFLLRKDWTLGSLFGATALEVAAKGLTAGASAGSATRIGVLNSSGVIVYYFYKNTTSQGGAGWRASSTRTDGVDRQHIQLATGSGFAVQNSNLTALIFNLTGEARPTRNIVSLDSAYTFVANPQNRSVTIADLLGSTIVGGKLKSDFVGASSSGSADEVTIIDGTVSRKYFFNTRTVSSVAINKWRLSVTPLGADQNAVTIGEGDAMLVKRAGLVTKFVGLETSAEATE
jgi:hypothetical protein